MSVTVSGYRNAGMMSWTESWSIAMVLVLLLAGSSSASDAPSTLPRFAYLFGFNGMFLKIDLTTNAVAAHWALNQLPGAADVLPIWRQARSADTAWLPVNIRFDRVQGRLYGVFPTGQRSAARAPGFQLLVFETPELKLAGHVTLPQALAGPPTLVVRPDGDQILLSFMLATPATGDDDMLHTALDAYAASDLQPTRHHEESTSRDDFMMARKSIATLLSVDAYFDPDGSVIYDKGDRIILQEGGAPRRETIDVLAALDPSERQKLDVYAQVDLASGRSWIPYVFVGGAAGRALFAVRDANRTRSAFFVVDLKAGHAGPVIEAPLSVAVLSGDGRRVVVERVVTRSEGDATAEDRTGEIAVYDLDSPGAPVQLIHAELAGPRSSEVCVSSDATLMIYAAAGHAHVVDLRAQAPAVSIASTFSADRWTQCVFADR